MTAATVGNMLQIQYLRQTDGHSRWSNVHALILLYFVTCLAHYSTCVAH